MVVTSKPITKYCCSDTTHTEARILALFSIITTIFCFIVLFLTYSQVRGEYFQPAHPKPTNSSKTTEPDCFTVSGRLNYGQNGTFDNVTQNPLGLETTAVENKEELTSVSPAKDVTEIAENVTELEDPVTREPLDTELYMLRVKENKAEIGTSIEINQTLDSLDTKGNDTGGNISIICTQIIADKDSKKPERGQLDLMAEFLLWDADTEVEWILPPFLWNIVDLIRGLLLLFAVRHKNAAMARIWLYLTTVTCFAGIILFVPIMLSLTATEFITSFVLLFVLVLCYNFYAIWIVSGFVRDTVSVNMSNAWNQMDKVLAIQVIPSNKFRVTLDPE